ncbi:hypothetical protein OG896_24585 [Streptomyces sp. NBC_00669]|uniref:hypothetical protein n=1 Tax=Streptomyces sp. NBC_00669 TaxID=2976011 RepID=UPI002E370B3C|nr:hypothetical protein [Streptomyces sp. NBC_00669]
MADCLHRIDLCPDCDGLSTVTLNRVPGISSISIDGATGTSSLRFTGPTAVYIGPAGPEPCPNPTRRNGG